MKIKDVFLQQRVQGWGKSQGDTFNVKKLIHLCFCLEHPSIQFFSRDFSNTYDRTSDIVQENNGKLSKLSDIFRSFYMVQKAYVIFPLAI